MTAEDLELQIEQVRSKQRRPRKTTAAPAPPVDAATRAAHDYDPEDLEPVTPTPPPPPAAPEIPEHLRQYLVQAPPPGDSRLERSHRQLGGTLEQPVVIGNAHGWLGCDWPGLARMAAARALAGLPVDDLDTEALKRAGWVPTDGAWTPPTSESS